jgi:hypothetical protein
MPTKREREYYRMGFRDGMRMVAAPGTLNQDIDIDFGPPITDRGGPRRKSKRKLSAWQKFVKANSKKPRFRLRSGSPNLKKLGVAYRKTPAGKKSKRR